MSLVLVDKSAWEQGRHEPKAAATLRDLAAEARLAICDVVALELLYSARALGDYERRRSELGYFEWLELSGEVGAAARDIQYALARRGEHRRPIPDVLIAATALVHGASVLHYDKDFDLIAEVTGQPVAWIVPRGTGHRASP